MKYISPLISDGRNKLGGTVWSRNRSGVYQRAHVAPTQPRTTLQQANRASFAASANLWRSLSSSQVSGWNTFADLTPWTDTLGHTYKPSGFQLFMQCQRNLSLVGASPVLTPPTAMPAFPDPGGWSTLTQLYGGTVLFLFILGPFNFDITTTKVVISATPGQRPGISFFAPFLFRNLYPDPPAGSVGYQLEAQYSALFPAPSVGMRSALRLRIIDTTTGLSSVTAQQLSTWSNY